MQWEKKTDTDRKRFYPRAISSPETHAFGTKELNKNANKCAFGKRDRDRQREMDRSFCRFTVHITNIQQKSTKQFQLEQRIFKSIEMHQKNHSQKFHRKANKSNWMRTKAAKSEQTTEWQTERELKNDWKKITSNRKKDRKKIDRTNSQNY